MIKDPVPLTLLIPGPVKRKLDRSAQHRGMSTGALVRKLLTDLTQGESVSLTPQDQEEIEP